MNRISILSIVIFNTFTLFGQSTLDSLLQLVDTNKTDVHTIDLYYQIAEQLQKSDNKQSIFYSEKGLTLSAAIKDSNRMAQGLILAGKSLSIMGLYSAAMNKYTECHIIVTKTRDTLLMANLFKNMGSVHWFLKDYNSALLHYKEALTLSKNTHDNLYKSGLLFNIGLSYSNLNQVDSGFFLWILL
jgi:tetratricopeptide (TPR) repeat protein